MRSEQRERLSPPDSMASLQAALNAAGLSRLWELPDWQPVNSIGLLPAGRPDSSSVLTSRFGGNPDLPDDCPWPEARRGKPLSFLAQIRLADLAEFPASRALPPSGWLWFFCETTSTRAEPECAVLFDDRADTVLHPLAAPMDPRLGVPSVDTFVEHRIQFHNVIGVPEIPPRALTEEEQESYWDFINPDAVIHKLLGEPNRIQLPLIRGRSAKSQTSLLLQLDSDSRLDMQWGDNGRLFFVLPEASLSQRDFRRCHTVLQSH